MSRRVSEPSPHVSGSGHIDYSQGDLERKDGSVHAIVPPFLLPMDSLICGPKDEAARPTLTPVLPSSTSRGFKNVHYSFAIQMTCYPLVTEHNETRHRLGF